MVHWDFISLNSDSVNEKVRLIHSKYFKLLVFDTQLIGISALRAGESSVKSTDLIKTGIDCSKKYICGLLSKETKKSVKNLNIKVGKYGKPILEELPFNISHSGKKLVCAYSSDFNFSVSSIGVDVQKDILNVKKNILTYFTQEELTVFEKLPSELQPIYFSLDWSLKESVGKQIGIGVLPMLKDVWFTLDKRGQPLGYTTIDMCNKVIYIYRMSCYWISVCIEKKGVVI